MCGFIHVCVRERQRKQAHVCAGVVSMCMEPPNEGADVLLYSLPVSLKQNLSLSQGLTFSQLDYKAVSPSDPSFSAPFRAMVKKGRLAS